MVTAIVTGAANGIGQAVAVELMSRGIAVTGVDLDETVSSVCPDAAVIGDAADPATVAQAFRVCSQPPQMLVNAAFTFAPGSILDSVDAQWPRTFGVSLYAAVTFSREFAQALPAGAGGSIVNIASIHAAVTAAGNAAYAAAKAGLVSFTRSAAIEWGQHGIRVNAVSPGFVAVERNSHIWRDPNRLQEVIGPCPLGRAGQPAEIAKTVAFLLSADASYINGTVVTVDGGLTALIPGAGRS